ncbi:MAG: hypothetical protein M3421_14555 [Bacteroidota bacterium]|jgi:cell pole-organizing protein PopZ|nr:hypothetical protein [Bacteroidota bacterium]
MEDVQLITYIIFAVLYLIFKVMQRKKEPGPDQGEANQQPKRPNKPSMTFEEMLREFSGEPQTDTIEEERPKRKPAALKIEPEPEKKYFSYETEYDEQAQKTYRDSIEKGKKALTLDEQVDIENIKVGNLQVLEDDNESSKSYTHEYLEAFRSLDGAKKAFVYSEIFKRKYF